MNKIIMLCVAVQLVASANGSSQQVITNAVRNKYMVVTNPDPVRLVWIPYGTFVMGSPMTEFKRKADEGPQTIVTFTKGFFMGKHEVTQGEYESVMNHNPSHHKGDPNLPVEKVTWTNANEYCRLLTERARKQGSIKSTWQYRLPTEAEWEYACRAGTTTPYCYGKLLTGGLANYDSRISADGSGTKLNEAAFIGKTTAVGSYKPNAFGLYDMHGNVVEWVLDNYRGKYPGGSISDPKPYRGTKMNIGRGGGILTAPFTCRSACRVALPDDQSPFMYFGFRVVLEIETLCEDYPINALNQP